MAGNFTEEVIRTIVSQSRSWGGFSEPTTDPAALQKTVSGLKQAVEQLLRRRGDPLDSAVLIRDLQAIFGAIEFLIGEATAAEPIEGFSGSHNDLSDVEPDQHHNQKHDIFSEDHDVVGAEPALEGDLLEHVPGNSWRVTRRMRYKGDWIAGQYLEGDTVVSGEWTMVAQATTEDFPAPLATGSPTTTLPEAMVWDVPDPSFAGLLTTGLEIDFLTTGCYINGIRVWVPSVGGAVEHRALFVNITNPDQPIVQVIPMPTLIPGRWNVIELSARVFPTPSKVRISLQHIQIGTAVNFDGQWTRKNYSSGAAPLTGTWSRASNHSEVLVSYFDDVGTDRTAEMAALDVGSVLRILQEDNQTKTTDYIITGIADVVGLDYYRFTTLRISQNNNGPNNNELCDLVFTDVNPVPVGYVENVDWWLTQGQPANDFVVRGFRAEAQVPVAGVENNAYGIDVSCQPAAISPDWGLLSFNGNTRGSFINQPQNELFDDSVQQTRIDILPANLEIVASANATANAVTWAFSILDLVTGEVRSGRILASHNGTTASHTEYAITGDVLLYTVGVNLAIGNQLLVFTVVNDGPNDIEVTAYRDAVV